MSNKLTKKDYQQIAEQRNHEIISFENYNSVHSIIGVHCLTCDSTWYPTAHAYKNAKKTGCLNCKKMLTSKQHKNKVVSKETRRKIGQKASERPGSLTGRFGENHPRFSGAASRDIHNLSSQDYQWKNVVRLRCHNTCVITGVVASIKRHHCHHLNSWNSFLEFRYDPSNGVDIQPELHKHFHDHYGYGDNTEAQFAEYCQRFYGFDWYERKKQLNLL